MRWEPLRVQRDTARAVPERCGNGHPYTPENTYVRADGSYLCRQCRRIQLRRIHLDHVVARVLA